MSFRQHEYPTVWPFSSGHDHWGKRYNFRNRIRATIAQIIGTLFVGIILATGIPWWVLPFFGPDAFLANLSESWKISISILFILAAVVIAMVFFYKGKHKRKQYDLWCDYFDFASHLRTFQDNITARNLLGRPRSNISERLNNVCDKISAVFQHEFRQTIDCCIRLASVTANNARIYITVGRSEKLARERRSNIPVTTDENIYKVLTENNCRNKAVIYNDVQKAVGENSYPDNIRARAQHAEEPNSILVAGIFRKQYNNSVDESDDENTECLMGILYIKSSETGAFNSKHIDFAKTIAESIPLAI
jgi:hypothetical protein